MVNVFAADLTRLYERDVYQAYNEMLPAWRKAKTDQMKTEDGKIQCTGAWALLMKVAEEYENSSAMVLKEGRKVTLSEAIREVRSEEEFLALPFVNLSHSEKYVLCAVCVASEHPDADETEVIEKRIIEESEQTAAELEQTAADSGQTVAKEIFVGCDVEKVKMLRLKIAERFFCPEEYEHLLSKESIEEQTDLFYRYWVLKESFIKATREGMKRPLNSFQTIWKDGQAVGAEVLQSAKAESKAAAQSKEVARRKDTAQSPEALKSNKARMQGTEILKSSKAMMQGTEILKSSKAMMQGLLTEDRELTYYYKEYTPGEDYKAAVCATENTFSPELTIIDL